jgi:hypothetical protein
MRFSSSLLKLDKPNNTINAEKINETKTMITNIEVCFLISDALLIMFKGNS